jgi:hypothetical protein
VIVPLFLLIPTSLTKLRALWVSALAAVSAAIVVWAWIHMTSPVPTGGFLQAFHVTGVLSRVELFRKVAASNVAILLDPGVERYQRAQQWQIVLLVCWCAVMLAAARRTGPRIFNRDQAPVWMAGYNLVAIVGCSILVYAVELTNSFRVWAPHLLLSALLLLGTRQRGAVWLCAALAIVASPGARSLLVAFLDVHSYNFAYSDADVSDTQRVFERVIRYDPARGPWCNSLVSANSPYVWAPIARLPPGIGIVAILGWDQTSVPLRSRYLLANPPAGSTLKSEAGADGTTRLVFSDAASFRGRALGTTPIGTVYENLDARCGSRR